MSGSTSSPHWDRVARLWRLLGPPLRPSPEDIAVVRSTAHAWRAAHADRPLDALLLGVTPEIASLPWPPRTTLVAVDSSQAALAVVWPTEGSTTCSATARLGDWRALPLADESIDLVTGDGAFTLLAFPSEYRIVVGELRRVVRRDARLVLRLFVRPARCESVADVADALWSHRIAGLQAFKWRLAMAVQAPGERSVALADVWRAYHAVAPDPARLVAELGWPVDSLATLDVYRDSPSVYSFPTLDEVRASFSGAFTEFSAHVPRYELGERCPTIVLAPRT